ncbi:MAG: Crp/Fnr family transcriptional regulator [Gammaproteobacteria bacterium]|jgi:CRP-like cAMP-binding protein
MDQLSLDDKRRYFLNNPLFSEIDGDVLTDLLVTTTSQSFGARHVVLKQGEPGDEMFVIVRGRVDIRLHLADEEEITIGELSAGEAFGEIALFDQCSRTATVVTSEPSEFLVLHRDAFNAFLLKHACIAIQLLSVMAKRLRKTNDLLKDSMYSEITARLADAIRNIANAYGKQTRKGLQIDAMFDDNELGEIAGIPGDVVTAQLKHWRKEGVINVSHGYLTLIKPEALARIN